MKKLDQRLMSAIERELIFRFVRSSGKGGQNVNKVNSKAELSWNVNGSRALPKDVKERFLARYQSRLNSAGELIIKSDRFRNQPMNLRDTMSRLWEMMERVAETPTPRVATRPTLSSKVKRLESKRRRSMQKNMRRFKVGDVSE